MESENGVWDAFVYCHVNMIDPSADPKVVPRGQNNPGLEYIKEIPLKPAHLQPSPPPMKLAGEWQNWTWWRGGDPGQKLGLPEAPTLPLMG